MKPVDQATFGSTMTDAQIDVLTEAARSAAEDVAEYRSRLGAPTWDDCRVGRMLARDPVFAELAIAAVREIRRLRHAEYQRDRALNACQQRIAELLGHAASRSPAAKETP